MISTEPKSRRPGAELVNGPAAIRTERGCPIVLRLELPSCPACGSTRLLADKTIDLGDGSTKIRRAHCAECDQRVQIEVTYSKGGTMPP